MNKVCIHTFLTPGFMGWGELFLEAIRYLHGEQIHVRIDSRNLTEDDIQLLKNIYGNIEIHNSTLDYNKLALNLDVSVEQIHQWRIEIERGITTELNHLFRVAISVDERYRSIPAAAKELRLLGYEVMLHSDADIYIRKPLNRCFEIMGNSDVSIYVRHNHPDWLGVIGGFLGFSLNDNTSIFMERWMNKIDEVVPKERWNGYGQSVLWYTVQDSSDLNICDLGKVKDSPKYTKLFEPEKELWLGNAKVKGPVKVVSIRRCWEDLKNKYPRISLPEYTIQERIYSEIKSFWNLIKSIIKKVIFLNNK